MRQAAAKPATAQIITFWIKVACMPSLRAREMPWLKMDRGNAEDRSASAAGSYYRAAGSIQLWGPALNSPFPTKIPIAGSALSRSRGANWLRRGRERTKPDCGCDTERHYRARRQRTRLTNPRVSD